jgi:7 transmembrane sweet-taste receptor of 3 GCPR
MAILTLCTTILIVWTVLDPWTWKRRAIQEVPPVSFGQCESKHTYIWFASLAGILFLAEGLTLYLAWKTSNVPDDDKFNDSSAVLYGSLAQLQSWSFGVPMLVVIGHTSSVATYFGRICIIWIFAVSSLVVVVGPKLISAYRIRRKPKLGQTQDRIHSSGFIHPGTSSDFLPSYNGNGHY